MVLLVSCTQLNAANWLRLQGQQPEFVAPKGVKVPYRNTKPKLWGFIQANYKKDSGTVAYNPNNQTTTPFSLLNPDLTGQEGFNVFRARLAARGMADKENKVNYFIMTEFGNQAINNLNGHRKNATYFTDASVTVKHIPGAKLRMGMFKTPSTEEGLQAVFVSPYIEFTSMANQQHLERPIRAVGGELTPQQSGGAATDHYNGNPTGPIGAFRDTGLQIFDIFDLGNGLELSYAYMIGNGSGVSMKSSNANKTTYKYLALEKNFGHGRGYYTESAKVYAWNQEGNRELLIGGTTVQNFSRERAGVGTTYYKGGLRLEAEYTTATGMVFVGAKDADQTSQDVQTWTMQYAVGSENKATGYYVNAQYEILPKKFELFARHDVLDRLSNDTKAQRVFTTNTVGASYRFRGATRVDLNYIMKSAEAPGNANAQKVLDNMGNRIAIQLTAAF